MDLGLVNSATAADTPPMPAELRAELSESMSKSDIAKALREAREWMTMH